MGEDSNAARTRTPSKLGRSLAVSVVEIVDAKNSAPVRQLRLSLDPSRPDIAGSQTESRSESGFLTIGFPDDAGGGQIQALRR